MTDLHQNLCYKEVCYKQAFSKEYKKKKNSYLSTQTSQWDGSFEHPKHMLNLMH